MSLTKQLIHTERAPQAIGIYSQAIRVGNLVHISGQIPLDPETMEFVPGDMSAQIRQVFENLKAIAEAANGSLDQIVKLNIFLTDLEYFRLVNELMVEYFKTPYPARAVVGVAALPKGAMVEMDAVMVINS
jgi:reactive intermediate/imine deaminase